MFVGLGYRVVEGPEIDLAYYNFDALNHDPHHPARAESDTFYVADDVVLRTQTSPMQVRMMERQAAAALHHRPGARLPARQRRDAHAAVPPGRGPGGRRGPDARATSRARCWRSPSAIFGDDRKVRLRPHFFPFTEPSVELDVSCFNCKQGFLRDGSRCPLCKGTAWIEILGSGMVDPNLYGYVADSGYDAEKHQGFAWGMGIERIAFLKHGVPDLRMFFENDLRLLEQFG